MSGRRRPKLFSFGRDIELANLDSWVDDPAHRALLVSVVDAFIEVARTRKLTTANLDPIAEASAHSSPNVRAIGVTRLVVLSHYFEDALERFQSLATHVDREVRLYACASLANAPDGAILALLGVFLQDESWEIRKAAAGVGTAMASPEILAMLDARLAVETDARVRVVLDLAGRFQRGERP